MLTVRVVNLKLERLEGVLKTLVKTNQKLERLEWVNKSLVKLSKNWFIPQ